MASSRIVGPHTIFVSKVPWTVCRDTLSAYFQQFGKVKSSKISFDKYTARHRGFGFVEFGSSEGFKKALATENHVIEGSKVLIYPNQDAPEGSTEV
ncbi:SRA stem-loop-interacting RNA-binding protein, mitochondrial-like [Pocillopora verrucosa]|uniref:SRA stem-loop-interacting RNA-binding protein, mitochondrial-like n=1 Tax=Pocillopora verrucosa TaxID=203993 RepID=UPI00334161FA